MSIVGIDPGKNGYVVCITNNNEVLSRATPILKQDKAKSLYDVPSMVFILKSFAPSLVILEKQQAFPGQGGTSNFSTGYGFGLWEGIICALGYRIHCPHSKTWQKLLLADIPGVDTKVRSIIAAGRLYPHVDLRSTERCKTPHDGKADALLMAHYGMLLNNARESKIDVDVLAC